MNMANDGLEADPDNWEVVATVEAGQSMYIAFACRSQVNETEMFGAAVGVAVGEAAKPDFAFDLWTGWVLKEHPMLGPMRMETKRMEDLEGSNTSFVSIAVWSDAAGNLAFFREQDDSTTPECTGLLERELPNGSLRRIFARYAGGVMHPKTPLTCCTEPPISPKKLAGVHWKGTTPDPWCAKCIRTRNIIELEAGLQKKTVKVDARDVRHNTGLQLASRRGWLEGVQMFLAARADVQAVNMFKQTSLLDAVRAGHAAVVNCLLEAGAEVAFKGGRSWEQRACSIVSVTERKTALHYAAENGHVGILQALLQHHADMDCLDARGATPLVLASAASVDSERHASCVESLLRMRANPSHRGCGPHATILHMAAYCGDSQLVCKLVTARAELDPRDEKTGFTPLMSAARGRTPRHVDIVATLVGHRADVNATSAAGKTAFDLAKLNRAQTQLLRVLDTSDCPVEEASHRRKFDEVDPNVQSLGMLTNDQRSMYFLE